MKCNFNVKIRLLQRFLHIIIMHKEKGERRRGKHGKEGGREEGKERKEK